MVHCKGILSLSETDIKIRLETGLRFEEFLKGVLAL